MYTGCSNNISTNSELVVETSRLTKIVVERGIANNIYSVNIAEICIKVLALEDRENGC